MPVRERASNDPADDRATAGVVAPPPLLVLPAILLAEGLQWWRPLDFAARDAWWRMLVTLALVLASLSLAATAILRMRRARTPVEPWKPTRSLLTDGAYALSRNPIYVAFLGLQLAYAWGTANAWGLLLLPLTITLLHWGVITREERYLRARFGDEYEAYTRRVRRWL
jgi:protein-S-isoprenylcysteine O-methyltransferase Ste14